MNVIVATCLTLVGLSGTAVVLTEEPRKQALVLSGFGLMLSVLFMALQAPDVSLSEIGVTAALVPLLIMLTVRKMREDAEQKRRDQMRHEHEGQGE